MSDAGQETRDERGKTPGDNEQSKIVFTLPGGSSRKTTVRPRSRHSPPVARHLLLAPSLDLSYTALGKLAAGDEHNRRLRAADEPARRERMVTWLLPSGQAI